jgi:hypothetical protein
MAVEKMEFIDERINKRMDYWDHLNEAGKGIDWAKVNLKAAARLLEGIGGDPFPDQVVLRMLDALGLARQMWNGSVEFGYIEMDPEGLHNPDLLDLHPKFRKDRRALRTLNAAASDVLGSTKDAALVDSGIANPHLYEQLPETTSTTGWIERSVRLVAAALECRPATYAGLQSWFARSDSNRCSVCDGQFAKRTAVLVHFDANRGHVFSHEDCRRETGPRMIATAFMKSLEGFPEREKLRISADPWSKLSKAFREPWDDFFSRTQNAFRTHGKRESMKVGYETPPEALEAHDLVKLAFKTFGLGEYDMARWFGAYDKYARRTMKKPPSQRKKPRPIKRTGKSSP